MSSIEILLMPEEPSAEGLPDMAEWLKRQRGPILCDQRFAAVSPLALGFARLSPAVQFQALFEGWTMERIVREVY